MRSALMKFSALPRDERIFMSMIVLAMIAHAFMLLIAQLLPASSVKDVNVRTLNFRLGDGGVIERSDGLPAELPAPEAKKLEEAALIKKAAAPVAKKTPVPVKETKRVSVTAPAANAAPEQRRVPAENVASLAAPETPTREVRGYGLPSLEQLFGQVEKESAQPGGPSIGDLTEVNPKLGQGLGGGSAAGDESPEAQAIRLRYTQQISGWVAKHRTYPPAAGGRKGRTVVRVRIDRQGYVRYYGIDETSGYELFDRAAIDMIRRASPMPSAPMNYPAGNLIEFLIPITFKP